MKTMNKRGSRIDPWGTPAFMSRQLEVELLITTRWVFFRQVVLTIRGISRIIQTVHVFLSIFDLPNI
jgi:hypothetical protein